MFIAGTFVAFAFGEPTTKLEWMLYKVDLRAEKNLATWFQSVMFLLVGLSFVPMAETAGQGGSRRLASAFFLLVAVGCVGLSADEAVGIHERIGVHLESATGLLDDTGVEKRGFSWVLVYGPVALLVLGFVTREMLAAIRRMPGAPSSRRLTRAILGAALLAVPSILVLEVIQGFTWSRGTPDTIFPCFEEAAEVIALSCLLLCNARVQRALDEPPAASLYVVAAGCATASADPVPVSSGSSSST